MKEFGADIAEFIAVGTAVKAEAGAGGGGVDNWRNNKNQPFTSDLSGQDFWTLIRAGYAPLGMVMGSCVYHVAHQRFGSKIGNIGQNVEIEQFTQALYDARELAMSRMQAEAEELHAEGIVGVQLRQHSHTWGSHTTEFFAIGTAVRPLRPDHIIERPTMVLTPRRLARRAGQGPQPVGAAHHVEQACHPVPQAPHARPVPLVAHHPRLRYAGVGAGHAELPALETLGRADLAHRRADQVLGPAERHRVHARPDRHRLVGQRVELGIARIEREDRGPGPPRVVDPLEQRDRRRRRRHDEQRLAAPGRLQPLQADPQVGRRALGHLPADQRGHQLGDPGRACFPRPGGR